MNLQKTFASNGYLLSILTKDLLACHDVSDPNKVAMFCKIWATNNWKNIDRGQLSTTVSFLRERELNSLKTSFNCTDTKISSQNTTLKHTIQPFKSSTYCDILLTKIH